MSAVDVCEDMVEFIAGRPTEWDVYVEMQSIHTFERKNLPKDKLSVYVIPNDVEFEPQMQAGNKRNYSVFVVFQMSVEDKTTATINPLLRLAEEISYTLAVTPTKQIYFGDSRVVGSSPLELYQGHLERHKQFAAALSLNLTKTTVED